jgi:predicted nucleotidyltransferase
MTKGAIEADRAERAMEIARGIVRSLQATGIDAVIVGSLARGMSREGSDIDILVRTDVPWIKRYDVETTVIEASRYSGFSVDIIYEQDLSPGAKSRMLADAIL